jgi:hypothetical protein
MKGEKIIMTTVKITKRERYESIKALVEAVGPVEGIDTEGIVAFCDKEIAALATRAEKAKERAAIKRAEGDELMEIVYNALTDEFESRDTITARINDENITAAKVTYRLTSLVREGRAVKDEATVTGADGKNRRVSVYKLA